MAPADKAESITTGIYLSQSREGIFNFCMIGRRRAIRSL